MPTIHLSQSLPDTVTAPSAISLPAGAKIRVSHTGASLLSSEAAQFLRSLEAAFGTRRRELLTERESRQTAFDQGLFPGPRANAQDATDFPSAGVDLPRAQNRQGNLQPEWAMAPIPAELDRLLAVVEGDPAKDNIAQVHTAGASAYVADFEDRTAPLWENILSAHTRLAAAASTPGPSRRHSHAAAQPGVVIVRPRSWRFVEQHFLYKDAPVSASLFDFGLYVFSAAHALVARGSAPYFSLPKLESPAEAKLWRDIFAFAEQSLELEPGTIRALVAIETVSAAMQVDALLFELREYAAGLECSVTNYLASFARSFRAHGEFLLPQRNDVTMDQPFLRAYEELVVYTGHRRGGRVLGSGLPQLPVQGDQEKDRWARARVRLNTAREIEMGLDGTRVSTAVLAPVALSVFRKHGGRRRQTTEDWHCYVVPADLRSRARGNISFAAVVENVHATLDFLEARLSGQGAISFAGRLEDMASAELGSAQLSQWARYSTRLDCGRRVDLRMIECLVRDRLTAVESRIGSAEFSASHYSTAAKILLESVRGDLSLPLAALAYPRRA